MLVKDYEPDYIMHTPLSIEITDVRHYHAHRHKNAVEFIYCISGSVVIRIAQEDLILKEGQVVTIDHDDIHFMHSDAKNILLIVHLNMASVAGNWESVKYIFISCASYYCKYYQKDDIDKVCDLLLTAAYIYLSKKKDSIRLLNNIGIQLKDLLLDKFSWLSLADLTTEDDNLKYKDRLNDICSYIQKNCHNKITLSEIADKTHINSNYLSQFMKRTTYYSFSNMLNYLRCYEAEKLLLFTKLTIQQISDECGFSSKKYFHRYFKQLWGTTPLQWRKFHIQYSGQQDVLSCFTDEEALEIIKNTIVDRHVLALQK